ncbi:hypothetical protein AM493_12590 [Flavobacterium akiainvivens]|uniref:DUF4861 domain-containing protein n=1 Tax=Flavobacterium akiainvivens TaxID=1202724 RepID=A0A0M9VIJ6_9FLAO|nr:hypothetical protein [Flavobacterium akiainvivens]KOS06766.1 hypothetical protein AM493_12590 [Flavobacterium akiainvivens]SFQ77044.1 hypothetical protein SAMN05444144_12510 [Flavobacterium akiainvivens]
MKKLLLSLTLFVGICANAQNLSADHKAVIADFVSCFKDNNEQKLTERIAFPLKREYPLPSIKNEREFFKRFDEVFDKEFVEQIKKSGNGEGWDAVGWRGIMLGAGDIWLDEDGNIISINHQSPVEAKMRKALIAAERETVHESVKEYKEPVMVMFTDKFTIRIDRMENGKYRYASWKRQAKMDSKPELIVLNGSFEPQGSGGNHYYRFANGKYVYICGITVIGEDDAPPAYLTVLKNGTEILNQDAEVFEP